MGDINFVCADEVLSQQFRHFMNLAFSESISEAVSKMSHQDKEALSTYKESSHLVDGHSDCDSLEALFSRFTKQAACRAPP